MEVLTVGKRRGRKTGRKFCLKRGHYISGTRKKAKEAGGTRPISGQKCIIGYFNAYTTLEELSYKKKRPC